MIILTLVASAHVHGAENTSNKHSHESILGKRTYQGSKANDNLAKRQKTDLNPPEQRDSAVLQLRAKSDPIRVAHSGPIRVVTSYLPMSDALKVCALSKKTRKKLEGLLLEKYNSKTKKWEETRVGDNLNRLFVRCMTKLFVPSTRNAIQNLPRIVGNKAVNHIIIGRLKSCPKGWESIINDLFKDPNPNNNSLTCRWQSSTEVASIMNHAVVEGSLSNVNYLILKGINGNEALDTVVPDDVGNKCVTIRNFSNGIIEQEIHTISIEGQDGEIILKRDNIRLASSNGKIDLEQNNPGNELFTKASGLNVQMIIDNEIVMAKSDNGRVSQHEITGPVITKTEASGLNPQVIVALEGHTIEAKSDTKVMHKDIWINEDGYVDSDDYLNSMNIAEGLDSKIKRDAAGITIEGDAKAERTEYDNRNDENNIRRFEFKAEGKKIEDAGIEKAECTRPQIIVTYEKVTNSQSIVIYENITVTSNRHACIKQYNEDNIMWQQASAYGTRLKLILDEDGLTGTSDKSVYYQEYHSNKNLCQETSLHGDAKITSKDDGTTGTAANGMLHQTLFRNGTLHQQITADGATTFAIKDDGIKATSKTAMQYLKNDKNETEVHHALIKGNSELSLARAGKVLAIKGAQEVIHNGKRLANHDRFVTIDLKGLKK